MFTLLHPRGWNDYELLDCGNKEKLERFGSYILRRPEPQAIWNPNWGEQEWRAQCDAQFIQQGSHGGIWNKTKHMPDSWKVGYALPDHNLRFRLALTSFKHVGLFPEQAANWDYIYQAIKKIPMKRPKVLNLFAYTGGASLAAAAAGADVVHVDSVRQVVGWAKENMELSHLKDIRWTIEDALKFVQREAKRGNQYQGILLDPPAYGIGAKGERWKLEDQLNGMMKDLSAILDPQHHLFLLNMYSLGLSALVAENLIYSHFDRPNHLEIGELLLQSKSKLKLPLGVFARFSSALPL